MVRWLLQSAAAAALVLFTADAGATPCVGTVGPGLVADPNDLVDDSAALSWCLNDSGWTLIELQPPTGGLGYIVNETIYLNRSGWTLTSTQPGNVATRAKVIAGRGLFGHPQRRARRLHDPMGIVQRDD